MASFLFEINSRRHSWAEIYNSLSSGHFKRVVIASKRSTVEKILKNFNTFKQLCFVYLSKTKDL